MNKGQDLFEWNANEYMEKSRKPDWFWALAIIGLAGSAVAFILGNFLFGIFIIVAAITMGILATVKPKRHNYTLTTEGIVADKTFYPYDNIESFWMLEEESGEKKLLIKIKTGLVPIISFPFEDDDTGSIIYETLSGALKEEPLNETIGHTIMDRLGF